MDRIITFFKIVRQQAWQAKRNKRGRASLWKVWKCLEMLAVVWNLRTFQPEIIQCTYTMQLCCNHDAHNAAPRFSGGKKKKKTKTGRKKYRRRLSLHARWADGTVSRTFRFDSVACAVLMTSEIWRKANVVVVTI